MATSGVNAENDRLLLIAPHGPANVGVVAAPEDLGDFVEGDVVTFTDPEWIQDGGNGQPRVCEPRQVREDHRSRTGGSVPLHHI